MSERYFQEIMTAARERHDIRHLSVRIEFGGEKSVKYGVSVCMTGDKELTHIHYSVLSLDQTIEEAVRRAHFDNGRPNLDFLIEKVPTLLALEADEVISEGGPA